MGGVGGKGKNEGKGWKLGGERKEKEQKLELIGSKSSKLSRKGDKRGFLQHTKSFVMCTNF